MLQTFYAERIHIGLNQVKNKFEVSNVDLCVLFATQQKKMIMMLMKKKSLN